MAERRRERKVVTVLFADLVGFTSRAESLDPEDVEAILSPYHERLRAELERHGGTVEKFIGDAVMAVFGAPVVHEDDAERAVRAALAIRDAIVEDGTLSVRIGVNTGEALVNIDARPESGQGMVAGDVVNTGARLQSAAPENGVLVGESTYRSTHQAIDYREQAPVDAKGKAEPVAVWEAVQARSRVEVEVQRPSAPLIGRDRELDTLVDALARARDEHSTQLVTLVGEPGIGKSRLVYELFRTVEDDPELIWWRHGRSLPYGEGITFWALGQMVKAQAGILETDGPDVTADKLRAVVAAMDEADWLTAHLRPLVGLGEDAPSSGDVRDEPFAAWRRFFENLADERPLVLVFEDLHWADDGLLDFVDHLVDWSAGVPILVVGSARPELLERRPGWGGGKRNATTISLSPLAEQDTARLLGALLNRAVLPAEQQRTLLQRAGGNPLYTEEFARMLAEPGDDERQLPETLHGLIAARLDLLARPEKEALYDAAVVGRGFWLGALESMNGSTRRELEERLHALARKEFVRRERRSSVEGDVEFTFLHALLRDVAYGQIPRADRAEKHARAARWIEALGRSEDTAEMLAHHYVEALAYARAAGRDTAPLELPARRALEEAGDRAHALGAHPAAIAYYDRALELSWSDDPDRVGLLVRRAHALLHQGGAANAEILEQTHRELSEGDDRTATAEVAALLAWGYWGRGEPDRAEETLRGAAAALEDQGPSSAKALVSFELARVRSMADEPDAVALARQAVAAAREAGRPELEARSMNTLGVARIYQGDRGGVTDIEQSLALAEDIGSKLDIVRAHLNLASVHAILGNLSAGYEHARVGLEEAERWGQGDPARWLRAETAEWHYDRGDWDDALRAADSFLAEVEAGAPHYLEAPMRARRALIWIARGDTAGALAEDERQWELARQLRDPQIIRPSLAVSAFVRLEGGDVATANERLTELFTVLAAHKQPAPEPECTFAAAAAGRAEEFLAAIEHADATPWVDAARVYARGEHARAGDMYEAIGTRSAAAYARLTAGDDANVRRALEFYRSVRAVTYVARAEELLRAPA